MTRDIVASEADTMVHHQSHRAGRARPAASMTLNLTAMIDVIFLLLIYFVITASFTPGEGILTAKLPQGTGTAGTLKLPTQPLRIVITAAGVSDFRLSIQGHQALHDFNQLYEALVRLQFDPKTSRTLGTYKVDDPVIINPQKDVRWQHVVNAFNAAVRARYTHIAFAQAQ